MCGAWYVLAVVITDNTLLVVVLPGAWMFSCGACTKL